MPIIYCLREDFSKFHMTGPESKFDVRGDSLLAECRHTINFAFYVMQTFLAWLFFGGRVRRAYRKAVREGRLFYVDRLPSGEDSQ